MSELKRGWQRVRFGEVVEKVSASGIPTPEEASTYIGLEHMDPESLSIRRWGSEVPLEVHKTRIRKGDVLFARRNTHLRRAAVAPFDAYFSQDGYAFRSSSPALLQDFLLFVVASDAFHDYAITRSAGTHSKRVRWDQLTEFEFALPPLEEQVQLARCLKAAASQLEAVRDLLPLAELTEQAEIQEWFSQSGDWPAAPMHLLGDVQLGQQQHPKYQAGVSPRPFLRVVNITDGYLDIADIAHMDFVGKSFEKHRLLPGDILITEGDLIGPRTVGRCAMFRGEVQDCCVQKTLLRFRPGPRLLPEYALWACRHLRYAGVFAKAATGTTVAHLVAEKFREIPMPVAPDRIQQQIVTAVDRWLITRSSIRDRELAAQSLYRTSLCLLSAQ